MSFFYFMGDIFSNHNSLNVLGKSLSALAKRQQLLSNNIANVDTPGYKRSDLDFQAVLQKTISRQQQKSLPLETSNSRHMSLQSRESDSVSAYKDFSTSFRKDGNNVDIEKEVVEINKNALLYNSALKAIQNQFSLLKYAIEEGE